MAIVSPRAVRDYPPPSPPQQLDRYEISVTCRITITLDAPDPDEARDRASDELDSIGDISNIQFQGQPSIIDEDVGRTL